ncbi:hypothetical protein [Streptomyces sp. NPDC050564]|uniref:hypothetical protein n=1 Tax=Streptomyces sp. NPDC050564 TaxID=3365631 RepID=UPI0037B07035
MIVGGQWPGAVERLAQQLDEAQAADRREIEAKTAASRRSPSRAGLEPAEYQRQLRAYVQTREYKAADHAIRVAVAVMKAQDAVLLCSARRLLVRRADGRRPPRRLPQARVLPGGYVPEWWMSGINASYAGIWWAIPSPGPELRLGSADDPLVQEVAKQARLLQASRVGYRKRDALYEAYVPGEQPDQAQPVPPLRGLSHGQNRQINLMFGRGRGIRVQPGRDEEFDQLHTDYFAVWERSRAYAAAVLALLRARV